MRLVGVEIEVEPVLDRRLKDSVEQLFEVGHHRGRRAEHAASGRDQPGKTGEPGAIAHHLDANQGRRLKRDPTLPSLPHLFEDRPGNDLLRRLAVRDAS